MSEVRNRGIRNRWLGLGALGALLLSGCAGAMTGDNDVRVVATGDGLYLLTRYRFRPRRREGRGEALCRGSALLRE